jgi:hypothetical protein
LSSAHARWRWTGGCCDSEAEDGGGGEGLHSD